jgi:ketosteroid isomerase-like protein
MKKITSLVLLALFTLSLSGQVSKKIEQEIHTLSDKFTMASLEGNLSEMMNFYAYDAISMPNYSEMIEGRIEIINKEKEMRATGYELTGLITKPYKFFGNHKNVLEIGTYEISIMAPGLGKAFKDTGSYMTYWSKTGGKWLISAEMWNTDEDPMERYRDIIEGGSNQSEKPAGKPASSGVQVDEPDMGEKNKAGNKQEVKIFDPTKTTVGTEGEKKGNVSTDPKQDSKSNDDDNNYKIKIKKK